MPADLTLQELADDGLFELHIETDDVILSVEVTGYELDRVLDRLRR